MRPPVGHSKARIAPGALRRVAWLLASALLASGLTRASAAPQPLTIAELRSLPPAVAATGTTNLIQGVVTYFEPQRNTLFIQDATGGTYVYPGPTPRPLLEAGDSVVIEGRTRGPGGSRAANALQELSLRIVSRGNPLPIPTPRSYTELASARSEAQWVEVAGTLRVLWADPDRFELDLATADGRLRLHIPRSPGLPLPKEWLHARVRASGVCGFDLGDRGAIQGIRLFSPGLDHISVLDQAVAEATLVPRSIPEIVNATRIPSEARRSSVEGTVTCVVSNGPTFIQSGSAGLEIALFRARTLGDLGGDTLPDPAHPEIHPGDRVSAIGYPAVRDGRAFLDEATLVVLRSGVDTLPTPARPLPDDWTSSRIDGCLIEVEGRIARSDSDSPRKTEVRQYVLRTDDVALEIVLPSDSPAAYDPGTLVRVRGVATGSRSTGTTVQNWRLYPATAADISVLKESLIPSSQSIQRIQRILLACAGILAALAGWVLFLFRQLGVKRTENVELEARIASRTVELQETNASLRREVAERSRAGTLQAAIYRISEATHSVGDLPELYRQLHEIIGTLMPARNFYIALYDRAADLLTFPYYADEKSGAPESRPWSNGLTEFVIRRREPLLADQTHIAELTRQGDVHQLGCAAQIWLGVPLIVNGRATGVMAVQDYADPLALNGNHQRILTYIAGQTAIAIERKRAEAALRASQDALRASQQRFRSAFASSPAIMTLSRLRDGVLFEVNDVFLATTGFAREEVIGYSTDDLGIWASPEERAALLRDVREHGSVRNREFAMRQRDGRVRTMLLAAELVEIDREPSILTASLDVTDRLEIESQLRRALTRERELGELKSNFVSLVSHEFRTPLEVILSSAEILERYHQRLAPEQREKQLRAIQKSVRRMADMMNEVLLLGRFEAGRVEFNPADMDLAAFLRRMRDEITAAMGDDPPIHLDPGPGLERARGDEGLLGHVFTNLLSNAVKYSPPSSPVTFSVRRDDLDAVFEISDRGCGIPAADHRHLFQSFHRGANVGDRSGTGLGLVIVKRCLDRHGGTVSFTSIEGRGTTFVVRLPLFVSATDPGDTLEVPPLHTPAPDSVPVPAAALQPHSLPAP